MKPTPPKPTKHYRKGSSSEPPGNITRYFAPCGASGTASRDFATELSSVSCLKCWTALKITPARAGVKTRSKHGSHV